MLSPDYLDHIADEILGIYREYETEALIAVVAALARSKGDKQREADALQQALLGKIANLRPKVRRALTRTMNKAATETLRYDNAIYRKAGRTIPRESSALLDILRAGYRQTEGTLRNITLTTAINGSQAYINALDDAWYKVATGQMSYTQAIRDKIKSLAESGETFVTYPSGRRDTLEVAVRRSVITGVNKTTAEIQIARANEMGCDLVEVTAHAGARPEHAAWQGKIFSLDGKTPGYTTLKDGTQYGDGRGLCGWNCRHNFYPYFEGNVRIYSPEMLKEWDDPEYYADTQRQRALERKIRKTKGELAAYDTATKNGIDMRDDFNKASMKLKRQERDLKAFINGKDLKREREREQVFGFGRSTAQKAVWVDRRAATDYNKTVGRMLESIRSGGQKLNILPEKQAIHLPGKDYVPGRSIMLGDTKTAQDLVDKYAGKGVFKRSGAGAMKKQEIIKTDRIIGYVVDRDGKMTPTRWFKIHYRKTGTHIVPEKED